MFNLYNGGGDDDDDGLFFSFNVVAFVEEAIFLFSSWLVVVDDDDVDMGDVVVSCANACAFVIKNGIIIIIIDIIKI